MLEVITRTLVIFRHLRWVTLSLLRRIIRRLRHQWVSLQVPLRLTQLTTIRAHQKFEGKLYSRSTFI
jgi:hypothetical protein